MNSNVRLSTLKGPLAMNQSNEPTILVTNMTRLRCHCTGWAIILGALLAMSCTRVNSNTFPDVDSILCVPKPKPPITTSEDAICFAAHVDGIADSLRSAQKQAKYDGWTAEARRSQDFNGWEVRIRSMGKILPSYVCTLSFTENGSMANHESICSYIK